MPKKGYKRKAEGKKKPLPASKKVHWGEDVTVVILPSDELRLKKAIQEGNVRLVWSILEVMDKNNAREFLFQEHKNLKSFWEQNFFYTVNLKAIANIEDYDSSSFQKVVKYFMGLDFLKASISFHSLCICVELHEGKVFSDLLREDFSAAEQAFKSEQQIENSSCAANLDAEKHCDSEASSDTNNIAQSREKMGPESKHASNHNEATETHEHVTILNTKYEDIKSSPSSNAALDQLLNWIYELPQWLQDQILQSTPVKALIESIEQAAAIYDKKSVVDLFVSMRSPAVSDSPNAVENNIHEVVKLLDMPSEGFIDMSMIYKESTISGWILPTVAIIGSGGFGDSAFNGLPMNFDGMNGIEGF